LDAQNSFLRLADAAKIEDNGTVPYGRLNGSGTTSGTNIMKRHQLKMLLMNILRAVTPPIIITLACQIVNGFSRRAGAERKAAVLEWEYVSEGWLREESDPHVTGWNVSSVLSAYLAQWPAFVRSVEGNGLLGVQDSETATDTNLLVSHNVMMSYAYVLALAAQRQTSVSILDWGGGLGHYYLISRAAMPDIVLDYHCKDVPVLCKQGRALHPGAKFYEDDACLARQYDLILASGSLQFSRDWQDTLAKLALASKQYVYVTRLPVVRHTPSFVVVQRPYRYGYDTEYLGWHLNCEEFLACAVQAKLTLVRHFFIHHGPFVANAPEQAEYVGFLFKT
jgi:putative methyltransferase (TIGR04325 family)